MWASYRESMKGGHLLFRLRPSSSFSKQFDSEMGASSLMVLARGSSSATFFPLWREGPSSFIDVVMGYLIGKDWWRGFGKEDTVRRGEWKRHSERMMGKGISLSINDNKDDVKGCNRSVVKRSIVLMKSKLCFRIIAKLGNSKRQHCS